QSPSRPPVDALGRPICPTTLFGIRAEGLDDGSGQGVFRVRSSILPAAASKLEEPNMDAKEPLVRTCRNSRAAEGRAKIALRAGYRLRPARAPSATFPAVRDLVNQAIWSTSVGGVPPCIFSSSPRSQIIALPNWQPSAAAGNPKTVVQSQDVVLARYRDTTTLSESPVCASATNRTRGPPVTSHHASS